MVNGFWSRRYLEEKLLHCGAQNTSPPLSGFVLYICMSSCSQWFVSTEGSICSFCIVISLIIIICASYLRPWHPPLHDAIWARREEEEDEKAYRLLWNRFFDIPVQWCGNYGHTVYVLLNLTWVHCINTLNICSHLHTHWSLVYAKYNVRSWWCTHLKHHVRLWRIVDDKFPFQTRWPIW